MTDPFALKQLSKANPRRLVWTAYSRGMELLSRSVYQPISRSARRKDICHFHTERGSSLPDTAVTSAQADLLDKAIQATEPMGSAVLELGSYRGATTERIAAATWRPIFVVDPYIGYGGWEADMAHMLRRIAPFSHVQHVRLASGAAAARLSTERFSFIFIDAVHDFANTYFDFNCWAPLLVRGGLIAFHDVDDFSGTNLAFRLILARRKDFRLWGYSPNLAVLELNVA